MIKKSQTESMLTFSRRKKISETVIIKRWGIPAQTRCEEQCSCRSLSVQGRQECGLSILRQPNKVICLQHHETESFSSPHHCLSTAFQLCICMCVWGYILFSNQPSPWRWPAPRDLGPCCCDNQKVTWHQLLQTLCLHYPDEQRWRVRVKGREMVHKCGV